MKRALIAWIVLVALSLQGSMVAYAAVAASVPDCQMSGEMHSHAAHKPCCPGGSHAVSCCCPDVCGTVMGVPLTTSSLAWYGRSALIPQLSIESFSSRGDSPLIRPPIL